MARVIVPVIIVLASLAVGCSEIPLPAVAPSGLTDNDVAVLRAVIDSLIRERLQATTRRGDGQAILLTPTQAMQVWESLPYSVTDPPLPPVFRYRAAPADSLDAGQLTREELIAWRAANRQPRDVPELLLPGIHVSRTTDDVKYPSIRVSAPAFATATTAVVYADFRCGACGEGWLIRLSRVGEIWRFTRRDKLWIS